MGEVETDPGGRGASITVFVISVTPAEKLSTQITTILQFDLFLLSPDTISLILHFDSSQCPFDTCSDRRKGTYRDRCQSGTSRSGLW